MGGVDVLQQGIEKGFGNINPTEALVQAGAGAALPVAREWAGGARPDLATRAPQVGEEGVTPSGSTAAPVSKTSAQSGETAVGKPATPDALQEQQTQGQKSAPFNTSPSVGTAFEQPRSTTLQQVDQNTVMPAETISVVQSNRQGLKAAPVTAEGVEGAPSTVVDTAPVALDIASATTEAPLAAPAPAQPQSQVRSSCARASTTAFSSRSTRGSNRSIQLLHPFVQRRLHLQPPFANHAEYPNAQSPEAIQAQQVLQNTKGEAAIQQAYDNWKAIAQRFLHLRTCSTRTGSRARRYLDTNRARRSSPERATGHR